MATLLQRLSCRQCGRRAHAPLVWTSDPQDMDAIDESMDDPDMYMDHQPASSSKSVPKVESVASAVAKNPDNGSQENVEKPLFARGSKLAEQDGEVAMLKGNTFLLREDYEAALEAFEHAIRLQPSLEEAHVGRINTLRKMEKSMRAFTACREALAHVKSEEVERLRAVVQKEYQANKVKAVAKKQKDQQKASKFVEKKMREEMEAGCPGMAGTLNAAAKKGDTTMQDTSDEDRDAWKQELLIVYRNLFNKPSQSNKTVSTGQAVKEATTQYSKELQNGLQIADGHRAMPRPEGVELPQDYNRSVGTISLQKLQQYNYHNPRLLISVYGDIFDVSDRPDKYGKGGPYYYFSGADISWGLASGQDDDQNVNKFFDVWKLPTPEDRDRKLQILCSWLGFYEHEYGQPVGRLEVFDNERNLPAPQKSEDCCIQ